MKTNTQQLYTALWLYYNATHSNTTLWLYYNNTVFNTQGIHHLTNNHSEYLDCITHFLQSKDKKVPLL